MMATVAESDRGRVYLSPTLEMEAIAQSALPKWKPDIEISGSTQYVGVKPYGMTQLSDLFTTRELVALTTMSDLVQEVREQIEQDARDAGVPDDGAMLEAGGVGVRAYADAMMVYLALITSKETIFLNTMARWRAGEDKSAPAFGRQALPIVWDYAEINPFAGAGGAKLIARFYSKQLAHVFQEDASSPSYSPRRHALLIFFAT
jgi:putative DNA methylase